MHAVALASDLLYLALGSYINPLIKTLKPQSFGTLAVDGWAVTFGTAKRDLGGLRSRPAPRCTDVTAHPSTASVGYHRPTERGG